jgi:glycosyltransferase involved in cell wall biosynthesis
MKIAYLSHTYKDNVHGMFTSFYDGIREFTNHEIIFLNQCTRHDYNRLKIPIEIAKDHFDMIIFAASGGSFMDSEMKQLRDSGILMVGMGLDCPRQYIKYIKEVIPNYDFYLTAGISTVEPIKKLGCKVMYFPPACREGYHRILKNVRRNKDCLYIGNVAGHPSGERRLELFNLVKQKFEVDGYGYGLKDKLIHDDFIELLNSYKIGLEFDLAEFGTWDEPVNLNHRIFEYISCGLMTIAPQREDIATVFDFDKEIIGFRNSNELLDKIKYYLDNESESKKIAKAGYARCWKDHTIKKRVVDFFSALKKERLI